MERVQSDEDIVRVVEGEPIEILKQVDAAEVGVALAQTSITIKNTQWQVEIHPVAQVVAIERNIHSGREDIRIVNSAPTQRDGVASNSIAYLHCRFPQARPS